MSWNQCAAVLCLTVGVASVAVGDDLPTETGRNVAGTITEFPEARVTELDLGTGTLVPEVVWAPDGTSFCMLTTTGEVLQIRVEGLVEERRLKIGAECPWISAAREGLLIAVREQQEVWVLDPTNLMVRKKLACPRMVRVLGSSSSSIAWAWQGGDRITVLDLAKGEAVAEISAIELEKANWAKAKKAKDPATLMTFSNVTLTRDGRSLCFALSYSSVFRLRASGKSLTYEESGPRSQILRDQVVASPDSRLLAVQFGSTKDAHAVPEGHPVLPQGGWYVYSIGSLQRPTLAIPSPSSGVLAFDPKDSRIYTFGRRELLRIHDAKGKQELEIPIQAKDAVYGMFVHPQGRRLLLILAKTALWVELH